MRYRLMSDHYINEAIVPEGSIIGDDTQWPFREADGKATIPSREMAPLDDEAMREFKKQFPDTVPPRDPTSAIPIQGSGDKTKAPPPGAAPPRAAAHAAPPRPDKVDEAKATHPTPSSSPPNVKP